MLKVNWQIEFASNWNAMSILSNCEKKQEKHKIAKGAALEHDKSIGHFIRFTHYGFIVTGVHTWEIYTFLGCRVLLAIYWFSKTKTIIFSASKFVTIFPLRINHFSK